MCQVILKGGGTNVKYILWQKYQIQTQRDIKESLHLRYRLHMNRNLKKNKETCIKNHISHFFNFFAHIWGKMQENEKCLNFFTEQSKIRKQHQKS